MGGSDDREDNNRDGQIRWEGVRKQRDDKNKGGDCWDESIPRTNDGTGKKNTKKGGMMNSFDALYWLISPVVFREKECAHFCAQRHRVRK